jgi:hypothetical protein
MHQQVMTMNAINFEYILAYFEVVQSKNLFRRFATLLLRQHLAFEAICRTAQPFGGGVRSNY